MRANYMQNNPGRAADACFIIYGERFIDEVHRVRKGDRLPASKYNQLGGSIGLTDREAPMRAKPRKRYPMSASLVEQIRNSLKEY